MSDKEPKFIPDKSEVMSDSSEVPFVFKDQRKIAEAKNSQKGKYLIVILFGIIAALGMGLYMHEVWALENPQLEYDRNIWIGAGDKRFFISYFNTEEFIPLQSYDCTNDGKVVLGTLFRKAVGDERAWHFTYEPERIDVGNHTATQIYKSLVDECRKNPSDYQPVIKSGTIDLEA
jgi:hypothetical protein